MRTDYLSDVIESAMHLGLINYQVMCEPMSDYIKQSEAKRWLSVQGYKPSMLNKLVDAGKVKRRKNGKNNAAVLYSKRELQAQILKMNLERSLIYDFEVM